MKDRFYTVIMRRHGDDEMHSYPVGIYKTKHRARVAGLAHEYYRGGKYIAEIHAFTLGEISSVELNYMNDSCGGYDAEQGNKIKYFK